ncbi:MAG: TetR/AcrR family transcriptional regulator [Calditrichaeota bacterium]|nr:MAG: TetR/AcrR family transcriptional regulator [Calditrichota bacterium]MBL1206274.1 TetR/AcrR family transcriptional regulator [Calditrichota bacterium]NOG46100.1 TetR/AcrR family transcriptional regulator [Calditrichota bacterium]
MLNSVIDSEELAIKNAAIFLFAKKGFNETTIVDISKHAGVEKKSVYHYFVNKKQILTSLLEYIWEQLADEMISLSEENSLDPLEKIDKLIDQTIDIFVGKPKLAMVFFNEYNPVIRGSNDLLNAHYINYLKAFAKIFDTGVKKDYIHQNIDGRVFLFFIHGGLRNLINEWAMHSKIFPLEKIRESIKYQIKHGILKW